MKPTSQQSAVIRELLTRGVKEIIRRDELEKMLAGDRKLRVYLGVDPTGPNIHLGHAVSLRKLRLFQDLGHEVILLIGDFTGQIGDPTDREALRKPLTHEHVLENAKRYKEQASRILQFSGTRNKPKILFNAKWNAKLTFAELIQLASEFTVQQMLERDMFEQRMKEGKAIHLHEFLYPLMQGHDSVAMDVDVEVGGNDQLFNMLAGRTLQLARNQKTKVVITTRLLSGTDGRKMSKSYHNDIGVEDAPDEMYGKVMSIQDNLLGEYFELATTIPMDELKRIQESLQRRETNPRDIKMQLAREIVTLYHGEQSANEAEKNFIRVFQKRETPGEMPEHRLKGETTILDILVASKLVSSRAEGRRKCLEGAVQIDGKKITDPFQKISVAQSAILKLGRHFRRLEL